MYPAFDFNLPVARTYLVVATLLILSGCATSHFSSDSNMRIASDLPDHFLVGTHSGATTSEAQPNDGCRNPMVDPRDGTKLQLVRSNGIYGDYKVSGDLYDVGKKEFLRIECSTGRAVGIVRR